VLIEDLLQTLNIVLVIMEQLITSKGPKLVKKLSKIQTEKGNFYTYIISYCNLNVWTNLKLI